MIKLTVPYFIGILMASCLIATYAMPGTKLEIKENGGSDPGILHLCESGQGAMLGLIPDPYNCSRFFYCVHAEPDSGYVTIPSEEQWCYYTIGEVVHLLYYDFRNCQCAYEPDGCYDNQFDEFFTCSNVTTPDK